MPQLTITRGQLRSQRFIRIPVLLSSMVRNQRNLTCRQVSGGINQYIIGTYEGSSPPSVDYRNWRFNTTKDPLRANYFEIWRPSDLEQSNWYLFRAYLTIFEIDQVSRTEKELVALHCDPDEPNDAPHAKYKQGPHLHVLCATDPLQHSHIALNSSRHLYSDVLDSFKNLSEHFDEAVQLVSEQVIGLY